MRKSPKVIRDPNKCRLTVWRTYMKGWGDYARLTVKPYQCPEPIKGDGLCERHLALYKRLING